MISGSKMRPTRAVLQSKINATIRPEIIREIDCKITAMKMVTKLLIYLQSKANLVANVPLEFDGLSNHDIGIFNIFKYVTDLSL